MAADSRLYAAFEAPGLVASAYSADGLVEALESGTAHFLVGVQWHPEMFERRDEGTRRLCQAFVEAARRGASSPP